MCLSHAVICTSHLLKSSGVAFLLTCLRRRCPEILLGAEKYAYPVDCWSVGCIIAEMASLTPLFPGPYPPVDKSIARAVIPRDNFLMNRGVFLAFSSRGIQGGRFVFWLDDHDRWIVL